MSAAEQKPKVLKLASINLSVSPWLDGSPSLI